MGITLLELSRKTENRRIACFGKLCVDEAAENADVLAHRLNAYNAMRGQLRENKEAQHQA